MPNIDIKIIFAISSTTISLVWGFLPYIKDIFQGRTKPHAYTWLIWTITVGTGVASLWYGGGGWGGLALGIGALLIFLVFLLSLKYGTRNITKSDTAILALALSAIVVWWKLDNPFLAVLMVTLADVLGYFPSFRKTFEDPWSETMSSWIAFTLSGILSVLALNEYNLLTMTYLVITLFANVILIAICLIRRRTVLILQDS